MSSEVEPIDPDGVEERAERGGDGRVAVVEVESLVALAVAQGVDGDAVELVGQIADLVVEGVPALGEAVDEDEGLPVRVTGGDEMPDDPVRIRVPVGGLDIAEQLDLAMGVLGPRG